MLIFLCIFHRFFPPPGNIPHWFEEGPDPLFIWLHSHMSDIAEWQIVPITGVLMAPSYLLGVGRACPLLSVSLDILMMLIHIYFSTSLCLLTGCLIAPHLFPVPCVYKAELKQVACCGHLVTPENQFQRSMPRDCCKMVLSLAGQQVVSSCQQSPPIHFWL